jgi:hypothetical protein
MFASVVITRDASIGVNINNPEDSILAGWEMRILAAMGGDFVQRRCVASQFDDRACRYYVVI